MIKTLWLLPCLAVALVAADLTGPWAGMIEVADTASGTTINTSVRAEFQQRANLVSGSIGRREDQKGEPIRNGRIQGKKVLFEVSSAETAGAMKFDLTWDGDRLEGEMRGAVDSGPIVGKVHLTRGSGH